MRLSGQLENLARIMEEALSEKSELTQEKKDELELLTVEYLDKVEYLLYQSSEE